MYESQELWQSSIRKQIRKCLFSVGLHVRFLRTLNILNLRILKILIIINSRILRTSRGTRKQTQTSIDKKIQKKMIAIKKRLKDCSYCPVIVTPAFSLNIYSGEYNYHYRYGRLRFILLTVGRWVNKCSFDLSSFYSIFRVGALRLASLTTNFATPLLHKSLSLSLYFCENIS